MELATPRWRLLGPALFLILYLAPTGALEGHAKTIAAAIAWMAVWWVSGAAPLAITSLLPLVLFPLLGVRPLREVAPNYADHMIFLFLGGFALADAVAASGLDDWLAGQLSGLAALPTPLMVPAIVSCSCAFMLPVAMPPNAIVIGSGHVTAAQLFGEGIRLNLISAVVIAILTLTYGRLVLPL